MADGLSSFIATLDDPAAIDTADIRARLDAAGRSGLVRESWKYSKLQSFLPAEVSIAEPLIGGMDPLAADAQSTTSANQFSSLGDPDSRQRFPLADLGLLVTGECLSFEVPEGTQCALSIEFIDGFNKPVQINVGRGAHLSLTETCSASRFSNHSLYLHLAEDARVEHARGAFSETCSDWSLTQCQLSERSDYQVQQYFTGGAARRSETQIVLNGRESRAQLTGAYRVAQNSHLDQQIIVEHRTADTTSEQQFHGIGAGKGQAVFNGRIHIHEHAPRSNAQLTNRNLALHPDAIINTKPELEIYTDDVKCAHGATIGQISEDSMFYLRSRGIEPDRARAMLCRAFISECIEGPLAQAAATALLSEPAIREPGT